MKRGTHVYLPIEFDIDLNQVDRIEFRFQQGDTVKDFVYPSETAMIHEGANIIDTVWTRADTYAFHSGVVTLDTRLWIDDFNPPTEKASVMWCDTLFVESEYD